MARRRSTVRFRNGAPQLDRIIRKDLRRLWTSRVGPNGYRKGGIHGSVGMFPRDAVGRSGDARRSDICRAPS
jgi:hypothetical protein